MELTLKEFLEETLGQVVEGVSGVRTRVADDPLVVVGWDSRIYGRPGSNPSNTNPSGAPVPTVEFDVALEVRGGTQTSGKAGVHVGVVNLGTEAGSKKDSTHTHRVRFSVPLVIYSRADSIPK